MTTTTSTITLSGVGDPERAMLMERCAFVSENGGTFAIRQYYTAGWFEEITINWPESVADAMLAERAK